MKQRTLIKVVGTVIIGVDGGRLVTTTSRGIALLKRGESPLQFIDAFLRGRGISAFTLNERYDGLLATSPIMFLNHEPKKIVSFTFKAFPTNQLGFYAKDMTPFELNRDMKVLKKVVNG